MPLSTRPEVLTSCPCDTCTQAPLADRTYSLFQHPATGCTFRFCTEYGKERGLIDLMPSSQASENTVASDTAEPDPPQKEEDVVDSQHSEPLAGAGDGQSAPATKANKDDVGAEENAEIGAWGTWGLSGDSQPGRCFDAEVPHPLFPWIKVDFTVHIPPRHIPQYREVIDSVSAGSNEDYTFRQRESASQASIMLRALERDWLRKAYTKKFHQYYESLAWSQLVSGGDGDIEMANETEDAVESIGESEDDRRATRESGDKGRVFARGRTVEVAEAKPIQGQPEIGKPLEID